MKKAAVERKARKPLVPTREHWRQPYIDSYNKLFGKPAGLPYLWHNIEAMEQAAKAARERPPEPEGEVPKVKVVKAKASTRPGGSVAKARAIFEELKGKSRNEVMAACDAAGINKGTAATQYGRWKREQAK
jgi:hypothetical protein